MSKLWSFYGLEISAVPDEKCPLATQNKILEEIRPFLQQFARYAKTSNYQDTLVRNFAAKKPLRTVFSVCFDHEDLYLSMFDKNRGRLKSCSFDEFMLFFAPDMIESMMYKLQLMSEVDEKKMPFFVIGPHIDEWKKNLSGCKEKRKKDQWLVEIKEMHREVTTMHIEEHMEKYKKIYKDFQEQYAQKLKEELLKEQLLEEKKVGTFESRCRDAKAQALETAGSSISVPDRHKTRCNSPPGRE